MKLTRACWLALALVVPARPAVGQNESDAGTAAASDEPNTGPAPRSEDEDDEDDEEAVPLYPQIPESVLAKGLSSSDWCKKDIGKPSDVHPPLCELSSANSARCPRFRELCTTKPIDLDLAPVENWSLARLLGTVLTYLSWAVLLVVVGFVLVKVVAAIRRYRGAPSPVESEETSRPAEAAVEHSMLALDPEALLLRAQQYAEQRDYKAAMATALMAFLRGAELSGLLTLHGSRTNGEYARALRDHPVLHGEFRRLATEVEVVEFRNAVVASSDFSRFYARIQQLMGKLGVSLWLLLGTSMFGCSSSSQAIKTHECGDDPAGYSVLCEALRSRGATVRKRFRSLGTIEGDVDVILVLRSAVTKDEQRTLVEFAAGGGRVVTVARFPDAAVALPKFASDVTCNRPFELAPGLAARGPDGMTFLLPHTQLFQAAAAHQSLVLCDKAVFAADTDVVDGTITSVADRRFFTNASLTIDHNAWLATALAAEPGGMVELVGDFTGVAAEHPFASLWRSGLTPWLIHVLLLGLVLVRARRTGFGAPKDTDQKPRRSFAEHARALGYAYARARASEVALFHYGHWVLERLRLGTSATRSVRVSELSTVVSARLVMKNTDVLRTIVQVRTAMDDGHDPTRETEHLAMMRELGAMARKAQNTP